MTQRSIWLLAAGSVLALAAGVLAVSTVAAQETPGAPAASEGEDLDALVKALGDPDFAARTRACEALTAKGEEARTALEKGTKSRDPQIRWASKKLLRDLDREKRPGQQVLDFGEDRDAADPWGFPRGGFGRDLDRAMEDLRRRMEELERDFDRRAFEFRLDSGSGARVERRAVSEKDGERVEARVDADGKVKVTVTRRGEDGADAKEETFEAESLEALEKEHPEVHAKVKDLLGNVEIRTWSRPRLLLAEPRIRLGSPFSETANVKKGLLGVTVLPVPELLRAHLPAIPEGSGLVVEEVLKRTPAEEMGLRRHDILLSVNGIPVSSADEIRSALEAVKKGGEVRMKILRAGNTEEVCGKR